MDPTGLILAGRWSCGLKEGLESTEKFSTVPGRSTAEIEKMHTAERIRTMEALWDALCHGQAEPDSPDWHESVLDERRKKIESGEAKFVSLEEAGQRLQG